MALATSKRALGWEGALPNFDVAPTLDTKLGPKRIKILENYI